jgi:hypothetical protein
MRKLSQCDEIRCAFGYTPALIETGRTSMQPTSHATAARLIAAD